MQDPTTHYLRPGSLMLPSLPPLAIYVHLPWCMKKCPYCDFNSHGLAAGQSQLDAALEAQYIDALLLDAQHSLPLVWGRTVQSIFMGGGTPSLFSPDAIDRLISGLRALFMLNADCEITLEANPSTFERQRFAAYRQAGVTRLSIGVQSFADDKLQALGRVHTGAQAQEAIAEAAAHFSTWNLDLMYALPGQSLAQLQEDVQKALSFAPPHLSIYHLSIEPNTYFAKYPPKLPDEDSAWDMLDCITQATAAAGMERYEISAFAQRGHICRHNLNYWQFGDYLGLGAGAHGKISFPQRIIRQQRHRTPEHYLAQAAQGQFVAEEHEVSRDELPFEFMLNQLRLADGFPPQRFTERTGLGLNRIETALEQAENMGLIERSWQRIAPSAKGFDFLSELQSLFLPE